MRKKDTPPRTFPDWTATRSDPVRNMHDVLSSWHRRAIVYCLQQRDEPMDVTTVTKQLAAWSLDGTDVEPGDTTVKQARSWVLHAHVLKMAEFGVLAYEPVDDTVWLADDVSISVAPPWTPRRAEPDGDAADVFREYLGGL